MASPVDEHHIDLGLTKLEPYINALDLLLHQNEAELALATSS